MAYLSINRFGGMNTKSDPRNIMPRSDNDGYAEAVEIVNMDITTDSAIITSQGFEEVSHIAGVGGVLNLLNYEKTPTESFLIITHGTTHYYITNLSSVWTSIGSLGAAATIVNGVVYKGTSSTRRAILGTDVAANTIKKWDGTTFADVGGSPPDGYVFEEHLGHLFVGSDANVYYSATENEDSWGTGSGDSGSVGFNDNLFGFKSEGQRLISLTRTYNEGITFSFDDTNVLTIPSKDYKRQYGCLSPKSVQSIGANAVYWGDRGVMMLGAEEAFDDQGVPRPQSLSDPIENVLENINKTQRLKVDSQFWDEKRQYWLATPYGTSAVNSVVWVYNVDAQAWTTRQGFYPGALTTFRNSEYKHEMYFGDGNNPYLYKFTDSYSYDGNGYTRRWKSKIFTFGSNIYFKKLKRLDLAGSMDGGTEFFVTIDVDGIKHKYKIDNTFLLKNSMSDYIGDNWLGDAWLGGASPEESRFKRFYAPLDFPRDLREGIEMQITIENTGEEQPFKVDFVGIDYEVLPKQVVPGRKYINTQVSV